MNTDMIRNKDNDMVTIIKIDLVKGSQCRFILGD